MKIKFTAERLFYSSLQTDPKVEASILKISTLPFDELKKIVKEMYLISAEISTDSEVRFVNVATIGVVGFYKDEVFTFDEASVSWLNPFFFLANGSSFSSESSTKNVINMALDKIHRDFCDKIIPKIKKTGMITNSNVDIQFIESEEELENECNKAQWE